ncbi:MAG TPA: response regulator, partial [Planctomycetota bacterium]|nr:response regulator [Planctomycetota bacterium]
MAGVEPAVGAGAAWPLEDVARENRARVIEGVSLRPNADVPQPRAALVLPIALPGAVEPSALMVAGLSARLRFDDGYRTFLELVGGHVSSALASGRALEEAQRRADALAEIDRAKTAFFSNVSHEFRTPLTLMLGPTDDLLEGAHGALTQAQIEQLELIRRSQLRLQRLVNALLEFSRIEAGRVEARYQETDLAELTRDAASSFRSAFERAGLSFAVVCPPLGQPVFVDHGMWETIVFNLVSNALKFTFDGRVEVALKPAGGRVALEVKDTGAGVPAQEMPRLFERFHRIEGMRARTHEGSGIGLALVQELVKLHGGEIQAASVPGAGTTFTVLVPFGSAHLPRERIQAKATGIPTSVKAAIFVEEALRWMPANQPAALPPAAGENAPRILLADDNADMRDYARRLLEPHYRVETVGDGEAALAIAKDRPPDLILTDVMMPGLDGFELLRRLRQHERTRRIPVVMLSARAGEEARIEGLSAGAEDYLSKPFSARELLARVRTHLELSRLREELRGQREQLYALFMQAPVAICVFRGRDLVFEMANPRYLEVSGRRDVVGRTFLEAIPEVRGQGFDDLLRGVMATGVPYVGKEHLARLDRDGDGVPEDTWFDFIYAPVRDERGVAERVMA